MEKSRLRPGRWNASPPSGRLPRAPSSIRRAHVRPDLIAPYLRKDGAEKRSAWDMYSREVRMVNRPKIHTDSAGKPILDPENALLIACELDSRTQVDIIARLMRVDLFTVNQVREYIGILKTKDRAKVRKFRDAGLLPPETMDVLEIRYMFYPDVKKQADPEADFRNSVMASLDMTNALLGRIEDLLIRMLELIGPAVISKQ